MVAVELDTSNFSDCSYIRYKLFINGELSLAKPLEALSKPAKVKGRVCWAKKQDIPEDLRETL